MNFLSPKHLGAFYAILSGLCYGLLGYFGVTLIHEGLSIYNMLFWRFFVAVLFMVLILLPQYKTLFQNGMENLKIIFYGIAFYGTSATIFFVSSAYIGTGLAMVLFFMHPVVVMLFNVLYHKQKIRPLYYAALFLLLIGMVCLVNLHELTFDLVGIAIGISAAFFYACYILASKKSNAPPMVSTLMVSIGCMITCLIAALVDGSLYVPTGFTSWALIAGIALVCTAIPILLLLEGLKYISSEQGAILSVLEPVFVLIFGIVLLDEQVTAPQIVGAIILLGGALMTLLPNRVKKSH